MGDSFSSWLLVFDGSGTPTLSRQELVARPGQPFPEPTNTDTIYLASGFPDLHPDSTLQLSPTLQLNGDKGNFDNDALAAIGQAELNRFNTLRFRSYAVEADAGIIVLATTTEQLNSFLDTYGGVLQITPLLSKGFSEEFETVVEPAISSGSNRVHIAYLVRTPLDADSCTLCGNCGPICPEACISEQLFLDLSHCTLCNACVKACPADAIDLHAVVRKTLEAPALLILDGVQTEAPVESKRIFTRETLEQLFATIFACRIDEVITCNTSICQYSGRLETGCRRCLTSCPTGAISATREGILIDQFSCSECGNCVATCPTGAIQYQRFSDQAFLDYFSALSLAPGCTVVLGCAEQLQKFWWLTDTRFETAFFLEYPEVQALTSMHLLFLLSRGVARVVLLSDKIADPLQDQINATNALIKGFFDQDDAVRSATVPELGPILEEKPKQLLTAAMPETALAQRREQLIAILQHLQKISKRSMDLEGKPFATFGSLECDTNACTLCLACLNECKIKALFSDPKHWSLNLRRLHCVQCGICVHVCPENALKQRGGIHLDHETFIDHQLARAEPMICRECGKAFGTRQSFERVMDILRHRDGQDDLKLYEYCDTCRVRKLYEDGQ